MLLRISDRAREHLLELLAHTNVIDPVIALDRRITSFSPDSPVTKAAVAGADISMIGELVGSAMASAGRGEIVAGLHAKSEVPADQVWEFDGLLFYMHSSVLNAFSGFLLDMNGNNLCFRDGSGRVVAM